MPVYLDDETVRLDGDNLGGILTAAQRRIDSSGRVIVEVQLDGQSLVGDELADKQQESITDGELRLYTADPKMLSIGVLEQARLALDQARQCQDIAAERFQQDKPAEAMQQITLAMGVWQQTQQAVLQSAQMFGLSLDDVRFDGQPLSSMTDALIEQLKVFRNLLAANDSVALADALGYEWPDTIDCWQAMISQLIQMMEGCQQ